MTQIGDPQGVGGKLGQQVFQALLYWRIYNLVFRAWLRPSTPEGRIAPVDDAAARGLLVGLNWIVVLPPPARRTCRSRAHQFRRSAGSGQRRRHPLRAVRRGRPPVGGLALAPRDVLLAHCHGAGKQDRPAAQARRGAALVGVRPSLVRPDGPGGDLCRADRNRHRLAGLRTIESSLLVLLLFETLMHPDHAPHRVGAAHGGRRGGGLPAPGGAALRADPDRRSAHGADSRGNDGGGMGAARPRRQDRGGEPGGDLRLLALP